MAKNELLEEILDDLSVIKGKDEARDKQLADIQKTLNELLDKFAQVPQNEQSDNAPPGNGLTYGTLKDAVYDGMADYYKDQPDSTGILTENNLMTIHDIFWDLYQKEFAKYRQEEKEEIQKKRDEIAKQRHAQGIKEISQVAEWASEYPIEIQRLIRFIGMNSLEETEPVETAHKILKVWGDTFLRATTPPPPEPPSLRAWLMFKWQQAKKILHNRKALAYTFIYLCALAIVVCLSLYQSAVMDLDRTNRIFYHNVIRNEQRAKDYHALDSLIHSNSFFKTYRTLDK